MTEDNLELVIDESSGVITKKPYLSLERKCAYLYKATYDTIVERNDKLLKHKQKFGKCTTFVKNGKVYRNLDLEYDNTPEFNIVCKGFNGMSLLGMEDGNLNDNEIGQLPYHLNDGQNDYGITIASHVLYNDFDYEYKGNTPITSLPYLVLTTLKSMSDISQLQPILDDIKIDDILIQADYLMQFMVSNGTTTYAITPSNNGYELVDISSNPKMTNFKWVPRANVNRSDSDMQKRPNGVERWNESESSSLEDLRFTKAYENPTRLSDFIGINETTKDSTDEELMAIYEIARERYLNRERNGETWQTLHSIIYTENGIESLYVQENYKFNRK